MAVKDAVARGEEEEGMLFFGNSEKFIGGIFSKIGGCFYLLSVNCTVRKVKGTIATYRVPTKKTTQFLDN